MIDLLIKLKLIHGCVSSLQGRQNAFDALLSASLAESGCKKMRKKEKDNYDNKQ